MSMNKHIFLSLLLSLSLMPSCKQSSEVSNISSKTPLHQVEDESSTTKSDKDQTLISTDEIKTPQTLTALREELKASNPAITSLEEEIKLSPSPDQTASPTDEIKIPRTLKDLMKELKASSPAITSLDEQEEEISKPDQDIISIPIFNLEKDFNPRALTQNDFHITPSTTLPFNKTTRVAHFPQAHNHPLPDTTLNDVLSTRVDLSFLNTIGDETLRNFIHNTRNQPLEKILPLTRLVILYQFQIMHTILDYKAHNIDFVVFDESRVHYDIDQSTIEWAKNPLFPTEKTRNFIATVQDVRDVFAQGIPDFYNELTRDQKDILYKYGGARVLLYLGLIDKIYNVYGADLDYVKNVYDEYERNSHTDDLTGTDLILDVITLAKEAKLFINSHHQSLFDARELGLKDQVDLFFADYKKEHGREYPGKVFIIYGAGHSLQYLFEDDKDFYAFERGKGPFDLSNVSHWSLEPFLFLKHAFFDDPSDNVKLR